MTGEMMHLLKCSTEESLSALQQACVLRLPDEALSHLHAIKGVFAMRREPAVVGLCHLMERLCRDGKCIEMTAMLAELEKLLGKVMVRLETEVSAVD